MKKTNGVRFTSWSPSRLADHDQCPLMAKHKHLLKTCPECFKGKIMGGFDTPAVCDTCGVTLEKAPAIERGTEIGDALDDYLTGKRRVLHSEIRHPKVKEIVKKAKAAVKKGIGAIQIDVVLTKEWRPCKGWDKEAWVRAKLDYREINGSVARVVDWKTGGIDKRTGEVRAQEKYDDQLGTYDVVTLSTMPKLEGTTSALVFLDCGPRFDPVVERGGLARKDLEKAQKAMTKRVLPMLVDEVFAPRPSPACRWCSFSKERSGPCPY